LLLILFSDNGNTSLFTNPTTALRTSVPKFGMFCITLGFFEGSAL